MQSFFSSKAFCYLAPFTALATYLIYMIVTGRMEFMKGYYELSYLFTYDHGFVSKGFVGEIISWFADTVTPDIIRGVSIFGAALLIVAASLCFGSVLDKTRDDRTAFTAAAVIIAILCFAPFTFRIHLIEMKQDKFIWAFALFAVYFSQFRFGIWLVPIFCLIATLINPLFLVGGMLLVSIILLQKCKESGFALKNIIICAISYVGMIAQGVYSVASGKSHGFADPYEMIDFYFSRYTGTLSESELNLLAGKHLIEYFGTRDAAFFKNIFRLYVLESNVGVYTILNAVFFALPLIVLLAIFWKKSIKAEPDKFNKFIFLLCPATLVSIVFMTLLAWGARFFFYSYIVQIGLLLYFIANKNEAVMKVIGEVTDFCKKHTLVSAAAVIYFAVFFN
ncbi:MAG: hypothetical protein J6R20_01415 [Clostridia bacterium]|nr:hypothetical protein [Clostridia bacterium]